MKETSSLYEQFVMRLEQSYGYSAEQIDRNISIDGNLVADIAVWRSVDAKMVHSTPDICIIGKCTDEHIRINADDYFQDYNLAALSGLSFYVAINLKETRVFYIDNSVRPFKKTEVGDFPTANDILDEASLRKFIEKVNRNTRDAILSKFAKCHNIIRNIDKLSPEAAFDEMSKVLFIKMQYERDSKEELTYTRKKYEVAESQYKQQNAGEYFHHLFDALKLEYQDDHVFETGDTLRIRRESFIRIIEELEGVNLGKTSDDIKGTVFENFLGKTFRGELGQFFTPRTVVEYMINVLDVKEGEIVCDPCCGSGGFLIKVFEHIQSLIDEDLNCQLKNATNRQGAMRQLMDETNIKSTNSRYYKLCHDYLFGVDANPRMARTAKMNMIMHGDGHVGVYQHDGLFNVGGVYDERFDVVLINPPFGARLDNTVRITSDDVPSDDEVRHFKILFGDDYIEKVYKPIMKASQYKDGGMPVSRLFHIKQMNTEVLFIERTLQLLKPGGRAGIVLPEGVMNNKNMAGVRSFIEQHARILNITSIPSDVFIASGANIKPSLLFIQKYTEEEELNMKEVDYSLSVTKVNDAGILSTGLPSENKEFPVASKEVAKWIETGNILDAKFTKVILKSQLSNWSVMPFFNQSVNYNSQYPQVTLKEVLSFSETPVVIQDEILYTRITVKLFNKGVVKRDQAYGREIGTKKQYKVSTGQFVVSKIDGKSGAFGIVPNVLDGSVVTHDFMVFDINKSIINPLYLELVMNNEDFLSQFKENSSGSTGRKRLSKESFLNTRIGLPTLDEQNEMLQQISSIIEEQESLKRQLDASIGEFYKKVFD